MISAVHCAVHDFHKLVYPAHQASGENFGREAKSTNASRLLFHEHFISSEFIPDT